MGQEATQQTLSPEFQVQKTNGREAIANESAAHTRRALLERIPENAILRLPALDDTPPAVSRMMMIGTVREVPPGVIHPVRIATGATGAAVVAVVQTTDARQIRVHFTEFNAPAGAEVFVFSAARPTDVAGPFEGRGPLGNGEFWTPPLEGDTAVIEYRPAAQPDDEFPGRIDRISHIFRTAMPETNEIEPNAGSCHPTPPSAWQNAARAVAHLQFTTSGGEALCTGTLITTQAGDFTPYLLTANHCINTAASAQSLRVYWNYNTAGTLGSVVHSDEAELLTTSDAASGSDYALLLIRGVVPRTLTWAGWTTSMPGIFTSMVGIHHPAGDGNADDAYKRFATGDVAANNDCECYLSLFSRLRVVSSANCGNFLAIDWNTNAGATEGGSSGSPVFRNNSTNPQVVGQLKGGCSSCTNTTGDDYYGRFDRSYNHVAANSSPNYLSAGRDDSLEENDSRAAARSVPAGTSSNLVVKIIDEDWYRISVPASAILRVTLSFTDKYGDVDTSLYRGAESSTVDTSTGTGNGEQLDFVNGASTTDYYVRVYLADSTRNTYSMSVTLQSDTQAPSVTINSPTTSNTYATASPTINIAGVAADNVGVTNVTWSNDRGGAGTATGTSNWSVSNISLSSGSNVLRVTARDAAGNTASDTLTVASCSTPSPPSLEAPSSASRGSSYVVSWSATSPEGYYEWEEATDPAFTLISKTAGARGYIETSRTLSHSPSQTTTYYYRVRARHQCAGDEYWSGFSAVRSTTIAVACNPMLNDIPTSAPAAGRIGTIQVTSSCAWSAFSNASWIFITSGGSGNGNGPVTYEIVRNLTAAPRVGTMTIAGNTLTITQQGSVSIESDMTGDFRADLLWRHAGNGKVYQQQIIGLQVVNGSTLHQDADLNWRIVATGDFNGDTYSDILWRNFADGRTFVHLVAGSSITGSAVVWREPDMNWQIVDVADVDGDGRADIIWRHAGNGTVFVVLMNGLAVKSFGIVWREPNVTEWKIVAVADINGDGRGDLLWRNSTTGVAFAILLNGLSVVQTGTFHREPSASWQIVATGDVNGDGKKDVLWRNSATGVVWVQMMNGVFTLQTGTLWTEPNPQWRINGMGDLNADGTDDLIWRNASTGVVFAQTLNGLTVTQSRTIHVESVLAWKIVSPNVPLAATGGNTSP